MTAQEQQMLQGLADRISQAQLPENDPDAEEYIQQSLGRNPDALYIMAQTVLVQQYALDQAQKQLTDLRAQLDQARQHAQEPKHATSFLGNLLGLKEEGSRPAPPPPRPPQVPVPQQYSPPAYAPVDYPVAPQGGGFLRSAMQTATGVAAGALAFEGIESLMHGFGHSAGYGTDFVEPGFGGGRPEEIVNNYYGDASPHEHGGGLSSGDLSDRHDTSQGNSPDFGSNETLHDASYVTPGDSSGTSADNLSGTTDSDYSANADDSMLADDVGD